MRACRFARAAHPAIPASVAVRRNIVAQDKNSKLVARLSEALAELPEQQREIFLAIRHERATYTELADRLGIGAAEAQRQFAAALVALVRAVDGE